MDLLRLSCTQSSGLPVQMDDDQPFVFLYDNYSMILLQSFILMWIGSQYHTDNLKLQKKELHL